MKFDERLRIMSQNGEAFSHTLGERVITLVFFGKYWGVWLYNKQIKRRKWSLLQNEDYKMMGQVVHNCKRENGTQKIVKTISPLPPALMHFWNKWAECEWPLGLKVAKNKLPALRKLVGDWRAWYKRHGDERMVRMDGSVASVAMKAIAGEVGAKWLEKAGENEYDRLFSNLELAHIGCQRRATIINRIATIGINKTVRKSFRTHNTKWYARQLAKYTRNQLTNIPEPIRAEFILIFLRTIRMGGNTEVAIILAKRTDSSLSEYEQWLYEWHHAGHLDIDERFAPRHELQPMAFYLNGHDRLVEEKERAIAARRARWAREHQERKAQKRSVLPMSTERHEGFREEIAEWLTLNYSDAPGTETCIPLTSEKEFRIEGEEMHHCVGGYFQQQVESVYWNLHREPEYLIYKEPENFDLFYKVRVGDKKATLHLGTHMGQIAQVKQFYGACNRPVNSECREAVRELFVQNGWDINLLNRW